MKIFLFLTLLLTLLCSTSFARKFDFEASDFEFTFTGGLSLFKSGDFVNNTIPQTITIATQQRGYLFGAMFGYQYHRFLFSAGIDYLYPGGKQIIGTGIVNSNEFSVNSKCTAYVPKLAIDFFPTYFSKFRVFFGISAGLAYTTIVNDFSFSPAAQAAGNLDYRETGKGNSIYKEGHGGIEFFAIDNYSLGVQAGYKNTKILSFKNAKDTTSLNGNIAAGAELLDVNGTKRSYDLSGAFAQINMRLVY